jgi:ABC-type nickel/cobalt efflux system permease component RcnA
VKRALFAIALTVGALVGSAPRASAHPLGNFTVNQFSGLHVTPGGVTVDLVTDMAEIPTYQRRSAIDANHDGQVDEAEASAWRDQQCLALARDITIEVDDRALSPVVAAEASLTFPPGQGGLPTLRLECPLHAAAAFGSGTHELQYRNADFAGRLGWREIVAVGEGVTITASDVPALDVTDRLTRYPKDLLRSPLAQDSASVRFEPAAGAQPATPSPVRAATGALPRGVDRLTRGFTDLVAERHLTLLFGLTAFGIALALGAVHALAPGHGKTVMAAYIVGERGTLREAALIGLAVTVTHTAGVLTLGVLLSTSTAIAPERLYPWFGLTSGLLVVGVGLTLIRRALRVCRRPRPAPYVAFPVPEAQLAMTGGRDHDHPHPHDQRHPHDHAHAHDHDHAHDDGHAHAHPHAHAHGGRAHRHAPIDPSLGWRSLLAVGFAGGLVPNPSALVVLLGAIALGRTWFGLVLVVAYGVGMAVTLTGAGLLLVRARGFFDRRLGRRTDRGVVRFSRSLPLLTSTVITVAGTILAARALAAL